MAPTHSDADVPGRSPEELLARARRRGHQLRRRRLFLVTGGGIGACAALAVGLALAFSSPGRQIVHVAATTTSRPSGPVTTSTSPETAASTSSVSAPTATTSVPVTAARAEATTTVATATATVGTTTATVGTTTATAATTTPTTGPPSPKVITATSSNSGQTVTIRVGTTLIIKLSADNWAVDSTNGGVLAPQGPVVHQSDRCVPGGTCGTTTATFGAQRTGTAQVQASRTYCGEAIRCQPSTDSWTLSVVVTNN